jgi:hypothetical protein
MSKKDDLTEFLEWFLENSPVSPPKDNPILHQADTTGLVLYRKDNFQVELFICKPFATIVQHVHPNVDSYEVQIAGDITFYCDGVLRDTGGPVRVRPDSWHGGSFGPRGGSFMSVQKWLNGVEPKFVGDDWEDHIGSLNYHKSTLTQGDLNGNTNEKSCTNEKTNEENANEKR